VRQLARLGCAALALLLIAGLTSIGLYSVVAGGLLNNMPVGRSSSGNAPVLVTIQAGSATPTPATAAGELATPGPTPVSRAAPAPAAPPPATGPAAAGAASASGSTPAAAPTAGTTSASSTPAASAPGRAPTAPTGANQAGADDAAAAPTRPAPGSPAQTSASPAQASAGQPVANRRATHEGLAAEIVDVEHGWAPINIDGSPIAVQAGLDIVTVMVQLTNTSGELRYVAESDLLLVGSDGSRYAPRAMPLAREPRVLTMPILPGDSVRGWQTYAVPPGVTVARAQWNPSRNDRASSGAAYALDLPR